MSQSDPAENLSIVRRYVAAVNTGELDTFDELFAPDYINHTHMGPQTGPEAMRQFIGMFLGMVDNVSATIDELIADNADQVAVRLTLTGTSTAAAGPLGLDAGRQVTMREIQIYRIADGKIAERWYVVDRTSFQ